MAIKLILTLLFAFSTLPKNSECVLSSIENTYQKGVSAYNGERWSECITQFEETIHLYKLYKSIIVNCRLKCNSQPHYNTIVKENIEDLKTYENIIEIRNCLIKCEEKSLSDVKIQSDVPDKIIFNIQTRKPYEYLHMCYYQMNNLPKASSAAYTFLVIHPNDESMKNNIKYYAQQPEVNINEIDDLETEDYQVLYSLGLKSYKSNNWAETAASMEEVITDYISSENICRAECESQPDQESSPEFFVTMSNNIASLLQCKQSCQKQLYALEYKSGVEFLAHVLNYLQISYYHLDRHDEAAKNAASYLTLVPSNEDMKANKEIYSSLVDENAFIIRNDILHYLQRDIYEKELLNLFHDRNNVDIGSNDI